MKNKSAEKSAYRAEKRRRHGKKGVHVKRNWVQNKRVKVIHGKIKRGADYSNKKLFGNLCFWELVILHRNSIPQFCSGIKSFFAISKKIVKINNKRLIFQGKMTIFPLLPLANPQGCRENRHFPAQIRRKMPNGPVYASAFSQLW